MEGIIHKVIISDEARCDYEDSITWSVMPVVEIKKDLEEYIKNMAAAKRLTENNRFRVKYIDEQADETLILFVYKAERFSIIQTWKVKGICRESEYDEEWENLGFIRNWINSLLKPKDKTDWVWDIRIAELNKKKQLNEEGYVMDYKKEIKDLLNNYRQNTMVIKMGKDDKTDKLNDKMECIDACIEMMDDVMSEIFCSKYIKGNTIKRVSELSGIPKTTIIRMINRGIDMIEVCFSARYGE